MNIQYSRSTSKTAICLLAAALSLTSPVCVMASKAASTAQWRLDIQQDATAIRSFRADPELHCSGSGQFSAHALTGLREALQPYLQSNEPIWIIDLRQESHGFLNGEAVSWHGHHNAANAGKDAAEVEADETARLQAVIGRQTRCIPMGNADRASGMTPFDETVRTVSTERQEAQRNGLGYIRIAATDMQWPDPQAVDSFLTVYRSLSQTPAWLHFHCHAGHGRTTTFMALYEMLQFPERPLQQVLDHQQAIGGIDLSTSASRYTMLQQFHAYVRENHRNGYTLSWSSWLARH